MLRWVVVVVVVGVLAAGCGGDDDSAGSATDEAGSGSEGHDDSVGIDGDDRCDLGLNTAAFNRDTTLVEHMHDHSGGLMTGGARVDFTPEQWGAVFVDEAAARASSDEVVATLDQAPILDGSFTHTLDPDPWVPMTEQAACAELAGQLQAARDAAARYPTAADALAAGYTPGSLYAPGQGAHFTKMDAMGNGFDPSEPEMLMFDGLTPESRLMGMSYFLIAPGAEMPEGQGFVGDNDQWHRHEFVCQVDGVASSRRECEPGGRGVRVPVPGWMLHAWVVPGCESDWGIFSGANPRLVLPAPTMSGCASGQVVTDPLEVDDPGDGPTLR